MHRLLPDATRGCIGLDGWINCLLILNHMRNSD
jgi:hypothetical protein